MDEHRDPLPPGAGAHRARSNPLDGRLNAVLVVFAVVAVINVIAVISDVLGIHLFDRLLAGKTLTDSEIESNDRRTLVVGIAYTVVYAVAAIVWIRWFHRAYSNLDAGDRRYGTGWAIGGWFVPILSLWRPKQIANDLWTAGAADREDADPPPCCCSGGSGFF